MDIKVRKIEGIESIITAPPSKSYTHRAFVIAALAEGISRIKNYLKAGDTLSTLKALESFGIKTRDLKDRVVIHGSGGRLEIPWLARIDCENSGTTIRLISSMVALNKYHVDVILTGDASIQNRPMQPLLDALKQLGVRAYSIKENGTPPVIIEGGGIKGGKVKIRGDISSQFISSLLISAPYAQNDVEIAIITPLKSKSYVDVTLDTMENFGIEAENLNYERFKIKAGQKYKARDYSIEGDYSSAAYFFALAALTNSKITVRDIFRNSKQGDRYILDVLKKMGAEVRIKETQVTVQGNVLRGVEVDLSNAPDLLPTITALACKAEGKTTIKNVEHARYKETDRISACANEFRKFGAKIEEKRDGLIVHGVGAEIKGAEAYSYNDHRMAMALTIAGLAAEGETIIKGAECVKISFPEFYNIINSIINLQQIPRASTSP